MSSSLAIEACGVAKCFHIYDKPRDRLRQVFGSAFARLFKTQERRHYRPFWALKECSFEIRNGEAVGVIGRNGSGKSTLLQLICGTLAPTAGSVAVNGRVAALLELGSGFNPEFTGGENVYMNASLLGLSRQEIDDRYDEIVEFAEIGDFIDQPVKTYSSGMMVRLAFSVIAHVDADTLIIDEALSVGDVFFTQKCMRFIRKFMESGTVLFVSHDTAAVRALCNRVIWLDEGSIVADGDPKEVSQGYLDAYFLEQNSCGQRSRPQRESRSDRAKWQTIPLRDQRDAFINASNLRNDLRVYAFDPSAAGHWSGGGSIVDVRFTDQQGYPLSWIVGSEVVVLEVTALAHESMESPIVGFFVRDRMGQEIFGDNTYLSYADDPLNLAEGDTLRARFEFQMPRLAKGDYTVTVALAEGDQASHRQHHWLHDALTFRSETTSVASGIVGIPMNRVSLEHSHVGR